MEPSTDTSTLGFVSLRSGDTRLVISDPSGQAGAESSGGTIYTTLDLPSLEELLDAHEVVYAVLERPAPEVPVEDVPVPVPSRVGAAVRDGAAGPSIARVVAPPAVSAAIAAVGSVLFVLALVGEPVAPNPYIGLLLLLLGVGLLHTTLVSLRHSGWLA
jgi:hypothetical protein